MAADYPTTIYDSLVDDVSLATLKTTQTNDPTYGHATVHRNDAQEIIATQTKLGTGASTAAANQVLAGTGAGVTGWSGTPTLTSLTTTAGVNVGTTLVVTGNATIGTTLAVTSSCNLDGDVIIANNIPIQFEDSMGGDDALIKETTNNDLLFQLGTADKQFHWKRSDGQLALALDTSDNDLQFSPVDTGTAALSIYANNSDNAIFQTLIADTQFRWHDSTGKLAMLMETNGNEFRVYDETETDYIEIKHNGTDAYITNNTGNIVLEDSAGVDYLKLHTTDNYVGVMNGKAFRVYESDGSTYTSFLQNTSGNLESQLSTADKNFRWHKSTGGLIMILNSANPHLRVYDSSSTDYIGFQEKGTEAWIESNNNAIRIVSGGGAIYADGTAFVVDSSISGNTTTLSHNGTDFRIITGTGDIEFSPNSNVVQPDGDNQVTCGVAGGRWSDVRSVLINGADIGFENGWKIREYPCTKEDVGKPEEWMKKHANLGLQFIDDDEKVVMVLHKNGTLYVNDIKKLKELNK